MKRKQKSRRELPIIPDKLYFTISEVSQLCALKAYVLRYWEQEFSQLRPVKRRGNRRFYQKEDILLIRRIRKLLYEDGFTISGARSQLSCTPEGTPEPVSQPVKMNEMVKKVIAELESVLQNLQADMKASH